MNYSYVFGSRRDKGFYIGSTGDLRPPTRAQCRTGALDCQPAASLQGLLRGVFEPSRHAAGSGNSNQGAAIQVGPVLVEFTRAGSPDVLSWCPQFDVYT